MASSRNLPTDGAMGIISRRAYQRHLAAARTQPSVNNPEKVRFTAEWNKFSELFLITWLRSTKNAPPTPGMRDVVQRRAKLYSGRAIITPRRLRSAA